jgi:hypothetical protein
MILGSERFPQLNECHGVREKLAIAEVLPLAEGLMGRFPPILRGLNDFSGASF